MIDFNGQIIHVPANEADFIPRRAVWRAESAPYCNANSRTTPNLSYPYRVGAWYIDSSFLMYGRIIDHLALVDARDLALSEDDFTQVNHEGRGDDARRYAEWMGQGLQPPPIYVLQMDNGGLRVTDGHRRVAAAKISGAHTLPAWISYRMDTGKRGYDGDPIYTALTFEGALYGAAQAQAMYEKRNERLLKGEKAEPCPGN